MIDPRKVAELGRVNLLRQVRDRSDLFFVVVLPLIIIVALALQFGGSTRARLGVVAPAGDPSADALMAAIVADDAGLDVRRLADVATLRAAVERGQLEAGLVIPEGFDEALRGGATAQLRYLGTNEALTLGLRAPVEAALARVTAIGTAARVAAADGGASWDAARAAAEAAYPGVPGVRVDVTRVGDSGPFSGFTSFTYGASTQLILFMFLTSLTAASRLVVTRELGLSRRMLATPTSAGTIVAGEALGRFAIAILQAVVIVAITAVVFGVAWGDPVAVTAIIVAFGLVATGAAMLVGALSSNANQASSMGVFVGLALGALGGCMVPIQVMPAAMQSIARLIPHSWALLGIQSLIADGGGIATVLPNLAVLGAWAVGLLAVASWRFRRAIAG
jgi:ABC-2 type transport system permease protein